MKENELSHLVNLINAAGDTWARVRPYKIQAFIEPHVDGITLVAMMPTKIDGQKRIRYERQVIPARDIVNMKRETLVDYLNLVIEELEERVRSETPIASDFS